MQNPLTFRDGPITSVMQDTVYRSIFLILVVQGVIFGSQMPFMPLWAKDQLGVGPVAVGTISLVTSLITTAFGLTYGIVTDRTHRRVPWLLGAFTIAVPLRIALAFTTDYILGMLMYAVISMAMFVLFFAILGDWMRYRNDPRTAEITNIVRLGFTIGWLTGSFGAGLFVKFAGYEGLFLATAAFQVLSLALLYFGVRDAPLSDVVVSTDASPSAWRDILQAPMFWYLFTSVCTGAAGVARMTLLPLYLRDVISASTDEIGVVYGIEPVYEIPISLIAAWFVARVGVERVLLVGIGSGIAYFAAIAVTTTFAPFLIIEALYAIVVTATFGFGIVHVQNLLPKRGGVAIAVYTTASTAGPVIAAPALGWVADTYGWPPVFMIASALMATATATFLLSVRSAKQANLVPLAKRVVGPGLPVSAG